jgi:hypothetical protein
LLAISVYRFAKEPFNSSSLFSISRYLKLTNEEMPNPNLLQTRQHFDVLDGLRGIAALGVVVFHFMEWVFTDSSKNFIGHGFLAVDFFFCLSGFVIGYAYDDRIRKMGKREFSRLG